MSVLETPALLLALLCAASLAGLAAQKYLKERHRSRDTTDSIRLIITMLVTFAALVLGLMTSSVKASFDASSDMVSDFSIELTRLDQALRSYGPEADPARALLRRYTAAAISSTWPNERPPPGEYYPRNLPPVRGGSLESVTLGALLGNVEERIQRMVPQDAFHSYVADECRRGIAAVIAARLRLIELTRNSISPPLLVMLVLWLVIIFAIFGLSAPRNGVVYVVILLCAVSISSAMYLILELDAPLGGWIVISSQPLRDALARQSAPPLPAPSATPEVPR